MTTTTSEAAVTASPPDEGSAGRRSVARFATGVLVYTVAVVLFGAVVRITFSGDGCGQHWPTCQGELLHVPRSMPTAIELTHRVTSGLSGLLVVGLAVLAFRRFPSGHGARVAGTSSVVFMIVEALVGRELVRLRLVAHDTSVARAVVMAAHLVNTSLLLGAIALVAWTARDVASRSLRPVRPFDWTVLGALGATLVVSVTGAVTALGDTVFPPSMSTSLPARLAADQSTTASFLERGRAIHPFVAFVAAAFLLTVAWKAPDVRVSANVERGARAVLALVFLQVTLGVTNIALSAPGYLQVTHLAVATCVWLAALFLYTSVVTAPASTPK